jgi:hypothetical protein
MQAFVRFLRMFAVGSCVLASLIAAALMLWVLVRPEVLGSVQTGALIAVLSLIALPLATVGAWFADRRAHQREAAALSDHMHGAPATATPAGRLSVPDNARPRRAHTRERPHRRRVPRTAQARP